MNEVVEKSINRAITILRACKCDFIAIDEEGNTYSEGDLKLAKPETEAKIKRKPHGFYADIYKPLMVNMKVGEVVSVETPQGMEPGGLRSCMGSYSSKMWGNDACITTVNGRVIELLRVK